LPTRGERQHFCLLRSCWLSTWSRLVKLSLSLFTSSCSSFFWCLFLELARFLFFYINLLAWINFYCSIGEIFLFMIESISKCSLVFMSIGAVLVLLESMSDLLLVFVFHLDCFYSWQACWADFNIFERFCSSN